MNAPVYPNIEKVIRATDWVLGFIFSLIRLGLLLFLVLIAVLLIVL